MVGTRTPAPGAILEGLSCPQEGAESAAGPAPKEAPGRQGRDFRSPADTSGFVGSRRGGCVSRCRAGGRAGPGPALGPRCWGAAPRHRSARPRATGRGLFLLRLPSTSRRRARTPSMTVRDPQCRGGPAPAASTFILGCSEAGSWASAGSVGSGAQRCSGAWGRAGRSRRVSIYGDERLRATRWLVCARFCSSLLRGPRVSGPSQLPSPVAGSGGSGSVAGY